MVPTSLETLEPLELQEPWVEPTTDQQAVQERASENWEPSAKPVPWEAPDMKEVRAEASAVQAWLWRLDLP